MLAATAVKMSNRFIALTIGLIIFVSTQVPQILIQRLVAGVLLCLEVGDIGCYDAQVFLTLLHGCADGTETSAGERFVGADGSGTFVRVSGFGEDSLTGCVGCWCGAVSHDKVVAMTMTVTFLGFKHCALDVLDACGTYSCFCHDVSALFRLVPYEGFRLINQVRFNGISRVKYGLPPTCFQLAFGWYST